MPVSDLISMSLRSEFLHFSSLFLASLLSTVILFGQTSGRANLPGHVHPAAIAANDTGRVDASLTLQHVSVFLQPSTAQQADLTAFLTQQQDPASANYHRWLTPEEYADRFGASKADTAKVVAWLAGQSMQAIEVSRGRTSISFTAPVRIVESAFATEIHNFNVNGETHYANATDPSVPVSLNAIIMAVHGLNDFRMKARARLKGAVAKPNYTSGASGNIYVGPGDLAKIYDTKPLLDSGIGGAGLKVAVVGQTDIVLSDIEAYRSFFSLPPSDPQVVLVPNVKDPGISSDDLVEADLDLELAGAMAPNATIIFVNSNDVEISAQYAIDQNLAPVLSMSYGLCETSSGTADLNSLSALAQQANAQGMTWVAASGDNGAADCYTGNGRGSTGSTLAVDAPASIPQVTGVGGTEFNEGSGSYWAAANDASHASALSYIPEMVWNDSVAEGEPAASGGGASSFFLAKPAWQTGTGVPADGARDVPDISLPAAVDHEAMLIYSGGSLELVGGTSCAAPAFAGMAALLNHYLIASGYQKTAGLGNINPRLYALAATPGVFHDIIVGSNIVNGCVGARGSCTTGNVGYNAGAGYDQASGLGSVDLFNLATAWPQTATVSKSAATVTLTSSVTTLLSTASVTLSAAVAGGSAGAPTGTVTFYAGGVSLGSTALTGTTASLTVQASKLSPGLVSLTAEYSGDSSYAPAAASLSVTVNATSLMTIQGITNAASYTQAFSPGTIVAIFGSLLAGSTQIAATVPLPTTLGNVTVSMNGTPVPLYFISPGQINAQIPYSIAASTAVAVTVTNNGQTVSAEIPTSTASPGIFTDSTGAPAGVQTAARGQTIPIYVTGAGAVSPAVVTGSTPSANTTPTPTQSVTVSVGGVRASSAYAYIGVPVWAIGLIQINFTVPATAPLGSQPVLVMINGTVSAAAKVVITQ